MHDRILQNDLFFCCHLGDSDNDEADIMLFSVKDQNGAGLVEYLRYLAFPEEKAGVMRSYLIRDNFSSELVGYFSVKAGLISVNELHTEDNVSFDTIPGVEIANFAINDAYQKKSSELERSGTYHIQRFYSSNYSESIQRNWHQDHLYFCSAF